MASNLTAHYGLNQWAAADSFVRTEFNRDNEKIDAALHRVDEMAQESHRALPLVTYNVYNLILQNYYERKVSTYRRAMLFDGFMDGGLITAMTGGVTLSGDALHLSGVNAVGTMTGLNIGVYTTWKKAVAWVRLNGGRVTPALNGEQMKLRTFNGSTTFQGVNCMEHEFVLETAGAEFVEFSLNLSCGTSTAMTVYDYGVIFL